MLAHELERERVHRLEARQCRAEPFLGELQERDRRGEIAQRGECGGGRSGLRIELERCGRDDAERALAADEEVAQVVAGVVLAQAGQPVPDLAARRHDFEAEAEIAGVAVAQHLRAAGIGRQVAADGAAALGGQAEREQQTLRGDRLLQRLQHAAGLDGDGEVGRVDAAHAVQAAEAQHHLGTARIGHGTTDQAGVAALRDDRRAVQRAGLHDGRDFGGGGRAHDGKRMAAVALAPVDFVGRQVAADEQPGAAHRGAQAVEQARRRRRRFSAHARALLAVRRCSRTRSAQAVKSSRQSSVSIIASTALVPPSPLARTTPSMTYSQTKRLSQR